MRKLYILDTKDWANLTLSIELSIFPSLTTRFIKIKSSEIVTSNKGCANDPTFQQRVI